MSTDADEIVSVLATCNPTFAIGPDLACSLCVGFNPSFNSPHDDDCPWLMARKHTRRATPEEPTP